MSLPQSEEQWHSIARDFEKRSRIPNVVGAIDGSLFEVKRFKDHEGWYCRKGFPAFNMQAVCDGQKRFISYMIRSGSSSDKSLFNNSRFGQEIHKMIPANTYFLADAGYQLFHHIMTPYPIASDMPKDEAHYNYIHSKARIIIEQTFGLYKGRFKIFRSPLAFSTPEKMAMVIEVTLLLHNWIIDLQDDAKVDIQPEKWMYIGGDDRLPNEMNKVSGKVQRMHEIG